MAVSGRSDRRRTSSLQTGEPDFVELRIQLERLQPDPLTVSPADLGHHLEERLNAGHWVIKYLIDSRPGTHPRDSFRHLNGFQILMAVFKELLRDRINVVVTEQEQIMAQDLVQTCFRIMTAAFHDHKGNQRYFQQRVDGDGWRSLTALIIEGLAVIHSDCASGLLGSINRTLGYLLACALNDDSSNTLFRTLDRRLLTPVEASKPSSTSCAKVSPRRTGSAGASDVVSTNELAFELAKQELDCSAKVCNPDALRLMLEVWIFIQTEQINIEELSQAACSKVPSILQHLAQVSTSNLAALHSTGVLGVVLPLLISSQTLSTSACAELRNLASILLGLGVGTLDDAHLLYRAARSSSVAAELLLTSLRSSQIPFHVLFDLSLHGYASIELPGIGQAFPPHAGSSGYTLSLWFQMVKFDSDSHTTIFGAFDASQTCFVLVYLEKDTHNLILQTSVKSSRPSVRFKSTSFKDGRWYHVAITHRRSKTTSSARASLFVDGEFVEQVKSHYPATPSTTRSSKSADGVDSSTLKVNAVQMFFGTPQDLASRLGKDLIRTQWRLASACLFADVLSDDLMAVHYELGPKYSGNFQDCLGSFQTYQASAALNIRNESIHPGKEEKSDIVSAIRSKAGELLPESRILLNVSASVILDDIDRNNIDESQLIKSLSKAATKTLHTVTRGRNALAINGAIPAINEALLVSSGFAVLTGDPSLIVPRLLDDAAWCIGGCAPVGLALIEAAQKPDEILRSLDILFQSIQGSWRNSEAMERENGFGVLATMLKSKVLQENSKSEYHVRSPGDSDAASEMMSELALKSLRSVLKFVGYRHDKPDESVINNPLAYRILLVDLDLWRSSATEVQKLYYDQFVVFTSRSKFHSFNMKRLSRMRIAKKWLEALKNDCFTDETLAYFLDAFRILIAKSLSTDTMRALSLYITYAVYKPKQTLLPVRGKSIKLRTDIPHRRQTLSSPSPRPAASCGRIDQELGQLQIALRVLEMYADILCSTDDVFNIKRFARTVTNKWLLHLLAEDEQAVVVLAAKILARLLVISGPSYMQKFVDKTGGMIIMQYRLRRWWHVPSIWLICFAVFFGRDPGAIDFKRQLDLFGLLETFVSEGRATVVYPEILPVMTAMLQSGLMTVTREQLDPESPAMAKYNGNTPEPFDAPTSPTPTKPRSISLIVQPPTMTTGPPVSGQIVGSAALINTVTRFLADIHGKSKAFRDFTTTSAYVQELFSVLFPIVVCANAVSPETELHSRESALTFKGSDVFMRPLSANSVNRAPVVRTTTPEPSQASQYLKPQPPKRMSSYVLIDSGVAETAAPIPKLQPVITPDKARSAANLSCSIVEEILELTIAVFSDQIFERKDFPGLGLFMRVPPGFQEHQAYFETFILRNTLSQVGNSIKLNQQILLEPRVLTNLARFASHLGEAIFEGWFIDGADDTLDFFAQILEYLQLPGVSSNKMIRLCSQIVSNIRTVLLRILLLRLSEMDDTASCVATVAFLNRLAYWQTVLWPVENTHDDFLKLFCFLLYNKLISLQGEVRMAAANLWRMLLVQKPDDISIVLQQEGTREQVSLIRGFRKVVELDNDSFLVWMDIHRQALDETLFAKLSKSWETFVADENRRTEETGRARISKRREKLKLWVLDQTSHGEVVRRHETSTDHWRSNIYAAENLKRQRALQDQQDSQLFNSSTWAKMNDALRRPCGVIEDMIAPKWRLDQTEGPNRMRMRFIPDKNTNLRDYQPRRKQSHGPKKNRPSIGTRNKPPIPDNSLLPTLSNAKDGAMMGKDTLAVDVTPATESSGQDLDQEEVENDFEMVDDPRDVGEEYEDKNRKVMRSLQRGDQVEYVHNVSRIVGLDAVEGILILGKAHLYLLDNLFQRCDGEIVNVWQAPHEERDPYLQMISGREAVERRSLSWEKDYETRSWRWEDVRSISKRRFLFRDVAIEVFFTDGRSYLLTISNSTLRNELYQRLLAKVSTVVGRPDPSNGEDAWKIQSVQNPGDETQTLGSRFTNVFSQASTNPATRAWAKGEVSNFHYLMLVNTMAGRTFNDLTQYPVFPWVLADYTSEELDLADPRSFRDLTKPMGCQNFERQAEFRDRYHSFAEMGDHNAPPFHYGTHYSSAMIVTSYLIRLQPFVDSYLLLQGGSFDHPDRLFYSIEKAWASASRENMTDVRELTPEFYYLPEFLENSNGYDFGDRQGDGGKIDTVVLPPWAKGDPKIFIAKHREALESDYVSQHLHSWIDLVFGHKQRGEAALEAVNVFHHLSYHGAKDLDTIDDPVERLATIGIIHNFGQTPHQIFQRPHPPREIAKQKMKKLESAAENLTRLPFPLLGEFSGYTQFSDSWIDEAIEKNHRISSLQYSLKHDRLLCSGPSKLNIGPAFDRCMEWGYFDGSIRFYAIETRKMLGLFEHVHQGQVSTAVFADSKTLITAGTDSTVSVWAVVSHPKSVDLQPRTTLFGHRSCVTTLAVSRSFSTLLSAALDGKVILWDLNRLQLVRVLTSGAPVECAQINNVTGTIMLCRGSEVSIWTLNGNEMLVQDVHVEGDDAISCCAFYEGSSNEYLKRNLIFTGHKRGVVNVWNIAIRDGAFGLEHVKRMHHLDQAGFNIGASITAVLPMAHVVYTGDDDGRVYEWDCIPRQ